MAYNKKELDNSFKSITIDGFNFKKEIMGYSWTKEYSNKIERIIIGYRGYPDAYVAYTPTLDIYFKEVEDVLNPLLDKFAIQNRYGSTTIQKALINIEGVDYSKLETQISNESSFAIVSNEINKIISLGAMPFFDKYDTLQMVSQSIEKMSEDDLTIFISGIVGIKIPLIKKLTQSDSFIRDLQNRNKFYTNEALKYPQYFKDHEKIFNEIFASDLRKF